MRLMLLRHGQTHSNVTGALDTGAPGADLTELGQRQAWAAARVLFERPVSALFVSTLRRTHQTAAPLAKVYGVQPTEIEGLREIRAGDFEMATDEESRHAYIHHIAGWHVDDLGSRMPGGETGHEFLARYDAAVEQIAAAGHETALLVSHGAAIRTWVANRSTGVDVAAAAHRTLLNTGLLEIEGDPSSGWRLVDWHSEPIGGDFLEDELAEDPTGAPTDE